MAIMAKQNYNLSLNEEKVAEIKVWLDKRGLTFSGYIDSVIEEQLAAMVLYGDVGSKVTVLGLIKIFKKMVVNLNESKKNT
jgi:hypothetical protein